MQRMTIGDVQERVYKKIADLKDEVEIKAFLRKKHIPITDLKTLLQVEKITLLQFARMSPHDFKRNYLSLAQNYICSNITKTDLTPEPVAKPEVITPPQQFQLREGDALLYQLQTDISNPESAQRGNRLRHLISQCIPIFYFLPTELEQVDGICTGKFPLHGLSLLKDDLKFFHMGILEDGIRSQGSHYALPVNVQSYFGFWNLCKMNREHIQSQREWIRTCYPHNLFDCIPHPSKVSQHPLMLFGIRPDAIHALGPYLYNFNFGIKSITYVDNQPIPELGGQYLPHYSLMIDTKTYTAAWQSLYNLYATRTTVVQPPPLPTPSVVNNSIFNQQRVDADDDIFKDILSSAEIQSLVDSVPRQ